MDGPKVLNALTDPDKNIRYEILAYRSLSKAELYQAVRYGISQMKKKPKRNETYTFVTVIGCNERR